MTEDIRRIIREEVKRQVNIILFGSAANATGSQEDIANLFPGMPNIQKRPTVHPYGFASKAPDGTIQVTARVGEHAGNRMVIGHRDAKRPTDLGSGEVQVYNLAGYQIRLKKASLVIGKNGTFEEMVMGETLLTFLSSLLQELAIHSHPAPGAPPVDAAQFTQMKTTYLDNSKILAKDGGRF